MWGGPRRLAKFARPVCELKRWVNKLARKLTQQNGEKTSLHRRVDANKKANSFESSTAKQSQTQIKKQQQKVAPAGNRTRVCTVAGYYSTTRPPVRIECLIAGCINSHLIYRLTDFQNYKSSKSGFPSLTTFTSPSPREATTQRSSAIRRRCVASLRLSRRRIAASRDVGTRRYILS